MRRGALVVALALGACGGTAPPSTPAAHAPAAAPDEPDVGADDDANHADAPAAKRAVAGRGTLRGTVTDVTSGRALAGVTVFVRTANGAMVSDTTNSRGEFWLRDLAAGAYTVTFAYRKVDFRKQVEVESASETVVSVSMNLTPSSPTIVK